MWKCKGCGETNPDSSRYCQSCGATNSNANGDSKTRVMDSMDRQIELSSTRAWEEHDRKAKEHEDRDAFLKENGHEGFYEYKVISVEDKSGKVPEETLEELLNNFGRQGWHLRCAFTNELGKNTTNLGIGGLGAGLNSTIEQNVLILERFIKFKD